MNPVSELSREERLEALHKLSREAVGLDVEYRLATGESTKRVYLDSTASTLRLKVVHDILEKYQPYYSNTHSVLHFGARLSTESYAWAHDISLEFVGACPEKYTAFFVGSGTTSGINRIAKTLREKRPDRDVVITSIMEHHSNDLPHRKHFDKVVHIPAATMSTSIGQIHMQRLEEALEKYGDRVNYVAVTGVSNVTGIVNPVHEIAALAHKYGALIVIDAAQMAAHLPLKLHGNADPAQDIDILVFSGHKIYAPGSPGVIVTRKDLFAGLEPQEIGGGVVDDVYVNRYDIMDKFPDREEAGTPNIVGAIGLAAALYSLHHVGMDVIAEEEQELIEYSLEKLNAVPDMVIYGETDFRQCARAGAVSFNLKGIHHALTAAVLNDYFNIAVRNHCFCAHPYVREMITEALSEEMEDVSEEEIEALAELHRGMVRASFGIYNTKEDVDFLAEALTKISKEREVYEREYQQLECGDYVHKHFRFDSKALFSIPDEVERWLSTRGSLAGTQGANGQS